MPEYLVWQGMKARALTGSSSPARYKERGITVCKRWLSFENFLADMGKKPTPAHQLERIDNDGPYSLENSRWATVREQALNRSTTRWLTVGDETMCMNDWARRLGVPSTTILNRLDAGWPVEKAVTTPPLTFSQAANRRWHPETKR